MEIFLDSACLADIRAALERRVIRGITTNPTLLRQEAPEDPLGHLRRMVATLRPVAMPICVQVMSRVPDDMLTHADLFIRALNYEQLIVKVPCGWSELSVVATLSARGVAVNCTAAVTATQAVMAASAGARYVTLFCGKMSDAGIDPWREVALAACRLRRMRTDCELMLASLRKPFDVYDALRHGADAVTIPLRYMEALSTHVKTEETVSQFARDFIAIEPVDTTQP